MKNFPLEKYRYFTYTEKNTGAKCVCAISTFAGKKVRGVARCDPADTFDLEAGKKLAALRCNFKVAKLREKRAERKHIEAFEASEKARAYFDEMNIYFYDAVKACVRAEEELINFKKTL